MIESAQIKPPPGVRDRVAKEVRRVLAQAERFPPLPGFAELAGKSVAGGKGSLSSPCGGMTRSESSRRARSHGVRGPDLGAEKLARHRIALRRDVTLAEHDLEQMRLLARRAEHLRAADQVGAPDAPEPLVEFRGVERLDARPVAVEALGPNVQRERVMPAQILDVDTSSPFASIAMITSARLGIHPPGKTCSRMKNSVARRPT